MIDYKVKFGKDHKIHKIAIRISLFFKLTPRKQASILQTCNFTKRLLPSSIEQYFNLSNLITFNEFR